MTENNTVKKISFNTNTAWLLNMWFPEHSKMWVEVREWINKQHDASWKDNKIEHIQVTFEVIEKKTPETRKCK